MKSLKDDIRLLYRVQHDRAGSLYFLSEDTEYAFVSTFADRMNAHGKVKCEKPSYDDAQSVVDNIWDSNKYITTTASLAYALWKCDKVTEWPSVKNDPNSSVTVVIIDASQVVDHSYTMMECFDEFRVVDADKHEANLSLAKASQTVLVSDFIPRSAVVGILDWRTLLTQLPAWFLNPPVDGVHHSFVTSSPPSSYDRRYTGGVIRGVLYEIRRRYRALSCSPQDVTTRLQVLRAAVSMLNLLGLDDENVASQETESNKLSLLTHLAYYLISFPIAAWPQDTFNASRSIPDAGLDASIACSLKARRGFASFIKQKIEERQEMSASTTQLIKQLRKVAEVSSRDLQLYVYFLKQ